MKKRTIIHNKVNNRVSINTEMKARTIVGSSGLSLLGRLRRKRSSDYLEAIKQLDAGGVNHDNSAKNKLIKAIKSEFPELELSQFPIGIVARCYLGEPYEVHTLDINLDIINHYKRGESLPSELGRAKSLALHPRYDFIEVYSDTLRAVDKIGNVSIVKG